MDRYCTTHTAMIYDRGGTRRLGQFVDLSKVEWARDRDGISEASIRIEGAACRRQSELIKSIASKRHELVIFRGDDRVWEGPIFRIADQGDHVQVFAKDVCAYLFGTALSRDWDNSYGSVAGPTEMTTRIGEIIEWELTHSRVGNTLGGGTMTIPAWESLEPPANILPFLQVYHFPNEARTAASTLAFQMTVGELMASAARQSGIDYTAVGRSIRIWDTSRNTSQTRTLTEADFFGNIIVTEYGSDHNQGAYVVGQEGMYGEAINPENFDLYGPWMTIYNAYNEEDTTAPTSSELNSQAARNTSGHSPAPVEVRVPDGSTIRLNDTLRINELVPGARVPLLATLNARSRNQDQKLDLLRVVEENGREDVKVTLSPANREDSDEEEE